jgi:hypothetical protein
VFCNQVPSEFCLLRFANHEHHNHDALFALTKLPAALFLWNTEKTLGIFSPSESLSIGVQLVSDEAQVPQCLFFYWSEDFDERRASLLFSMKRVTKAATLRASRSSASHTTIDILNIFDPFRISIAFISEYPG